jgi:hypothetical protein
MYRYSVKSAACTIGTNDAPPDVTSAGALCTSDEPDARPNGRPVEAFRLDNHRESGPINARDIAILTGDRTAPVLPKDRSNHSRQPAAGKCMRIRPAFEGSGARQLFSSSSMR